MLFFRVLLMCHVLQQLLPLLLQQQLLPLHLLCHVLQLLLHQLLYHVLL
jgi:hypothetical protein